MTSDPAPQLPFDALRRIGIGAAQKLSGNIWTDYNLHDPGVTLLEQTAFALTEIAYQSDHAVRDLLTDRHQQTPFDHLGLFDPSEVLTSLPVTLADIAGHLSDIDGVERVFARKGPALGLINLLIVPAEDDGHVTANLPEQVRGEFAQQRLLCSDVQNVEIATQQAVILHGTLQIDPLADPDAVAAEVIFRAKHVMRGIHPGQMDQTQGASRADAFEDPSALRPALLSESAGAKQLDMILAAIKGIKMVQEVTHFDVIVQETGQSIKAFSLPQNAYFEAGQPTQEKLRTLTLQRDNARVILNLHAIKDELVRWEAAEIAAKGNRKDACDWDVLTPGQHRKIGPTIADAMLPAIYRPVPQPNVPASQHRAMATDQLTAYRRLIDAHLGKLAAPIADIESRFCVSQTIDFTDPEQVRDRIDVLDYLIALQGDVMPKIDPATLHAYRGLSQQQRWKVEWREGYLARLALFNSFKGSADRKYGFAGRLTHLADLWPADHAVLDPALVQLSAPETSMRLPDLTSLTAEPNRPFDVFVNRRDDVRPLDKALIKRHCPWVLDGRTTPDLFRQAAQQKAYRIIPTSDGQYTLCFDRGTGQRNHVCDKGTDRTSLEALGNRIRLTFQILNQQAETLWLIEDICLRQRIDDFHPATAYALLPNWTVRGTDSAFRQYVSGLIHKIAPAHIHIRLSWLSPRKMNLVKKRYAAWQDKPSDSSAKKLRTTLRRLGGTT